MAQTPEQPDDDEEPTDGTPHFDDEDLLNFPEISWRAQAVIFVGLAALAGGGLLIASESQPKAPPRVGAILTTASGWPYVGVTKENGTILAIARGTHVEAFCYDLHANDNFGGYRFIIDEGLYNGQVAQTDRGHLYTTGDPWPPTGMSRHGDPFNALPNCS